MDIIRDKSEPIPINYMNSYINSDMNSNEYSLRQNLFDPFKSSPPNDFIIKLRTRIRTYSYNKEYNCNTK